MSRCFRFPIIYEDWILILFHNSLSCGYRYILGYTWWTVHLVYEQWILNFLIDRSKLNRLYLFLVSSSSPRKIIPFKRNVLQTTIWYPRMASYPESWPCITHTNTWENPPVARYHETFQNLLFSLDSLLCPLLVMNLSGHAVAWKYLKTLIQLLPLVLLDVSLTKTQCHTSNGPRWSDSIVNQQSQHTNVLSNVVWLMVAPVFLSYSRLLPVMIRMMRQLIRANSRFGLREISKANQGFDIPLHLIMLNTSSYSKLHGIFDFYLLLHDALD